MILLCASVIGFFLRIGKNQYYNNNTGTKLDYFSQTVSIEHHRPTPTEAAGLPD